MELNNKGQGFTFDIVRFSIALIVFVFAFSIISSTTGGVKATLVKYDYKNSVSIITEGVVNSPECLLYTGENSIQDFSRNIISWDKIDSAENCLTKGPYQWEATVIDNDETEGDIQKTIGGYCGSNPEELSKNILIMRDAELHSGEITVKAGSRDFRAEFDESSEYTTGAVLFVKNTGSCNTVYMFKEEKIDSGGSVIDVNGPHEIEYECKGECPSHCNSEVFCSVLKSGETGNTGNRLEYINLEDNYVSKVTVWPEDIPGYKKSYEY